MPPIHEGGFQLQMTVALGTTYSVMLSFPECLGRALDDERSVDDGNKCCCAIKSIPFDLIVHV